MKKPIVILALLAAVRLAFPAEAAAPTVSLGGAVLEVAAGQTAPLSVAVTDRSGGVELGRAVIPPDELMTVLSERPAGSQSVADGVTVEVRRNEVWLVVGGAEAAVGLDDLTDAVAAATPDV